MNLRVSVTQLDEFRLCCTEDWKSERELIDRIKGQPVEVTEAMAFGTAWQQILESPTHFMGRDTPDGDSYYSVDGFTFQGEDIARGLTTIPAGAVPEVKLAFPVELDRLTVDVVAKADALHGLTVYENKAKLGAYHAGDYEPSLQWRFYLWLFQAQVCQYNVFLFHLDKNDVATLKDVQHLRFFPYPELEADARRWLREFLGWASDRRLWPYLRREGTPV